METEKNIDSVYNELMLIAIKKNISNNELKKKIYILQNNISWPSFIRYIQRHGVCSIVLDNLLKVAPKAIKQENIGLVKNTIHFALRQNLKKISELKKILRLFNAYNIAVIPWKGPFLSNEVYDNIAIRAYGDLDVLVQKKDLWKAKELLVSNGYVPFWKMNESQEKNYIKHRHSYELLKKDNADVELHWKLAKDQYMLDVIKLGFWKECTPSNFLGQVINRPSKEHLIVGTAIHHGGVECWLKFKLIVDFYYLLEKYSDADWEKIILLSDEIGIRRVIVVGMLIAKNLFSYEIPDTMAKKIKSVDKKLTKEIIKNIFAENPIEKQSSILIKLREKWYHKVLVSYRILMTPSLIDDYNSGNSKVIKILKRPIRLYNKFVLKQDDEILTRYSNRGN